MQDDPSLNFLSFYIPTWYVSIHLHTNLIHFNTSAYQPDMFQYIWHCALVLLLRASGAAHTGRLPRRKIFGGNISCKRTRWRRGEAPFWRARQIQTVGCRAPLNSSRAPSKNYKCNWWLGYLYGEAPFWRCENCIRLFFTMFVSSGSFQKLRKHRDRVGRWSAKILFKMFT